MLEHSKDCYNCWHSIWPTMRLATFRTEHSRVSCLSELLICLTTDSKSWTTRHTVCLTIVFHWRESIWATTKYRLSQERHSPMIHGFLTNLRRSISRTIVCPSSRLTWQLARKKLFIWILVTTISTKYADVSNQHLHQPPLFHWESEILMSTKCGDQN